MPTVFPFLHNSEKMIGGGEAPIIERLEWLTDVMPAFTDYEQRVDLRPYGPRRIFEYAIPLSDARTRRLFDRITFTPTQVYYVPVCSDVTVTTNPATNSGVNLDAQYRDFDIGGFAMLWSNPWTYDFVTITGTSSTSISYTTTLANSWPSGSVIVPMRRAYLGQKVSGQHHLTNTETVNCEFHVLAEEQSTNRLKSYSPTNHRSLPVFDFAPVSVQWVDDKPYTIEYRGANIDFQSGVFSQRAQDTGSTKTLRVRLLFSTRATIAEFLHWLNATHGRQKLRWIASDQDDFLYISGVGTSALTVEASGYAAMFAASNSRRDVQITNNDSIEFNDTVTSVGTSGANEVLNFANPYLGLTVRQISFLHLSRLNSDTVDLAWHSKGRVLEAVLEFKEVLNSAWID
jgi:hypothetical protein